MAGQHDVAVCLKDLCFMKTTTQELSMTTSALKGAGTCVGERLEFG